MSIRRVGDEAADGNLTVDRSGSFEVDLRRQGPDFSSRGRIVGTVIERSTRRPIAGAVVNVFEASRQVLTDEQGYFTIQELPVGVFSLSVEMLGYAARTEPISVEAGQTTSAEIALAVEPIELEPIVVEVRSQYLERVGFYRRARNELGGWQWTEEEIDRWGTFHLSCPFWGRYSVTRCSQRLSMPATTTYSTPKSSSMTAYITSSRTVGAGRHLTRNGRWSLPK